MRGVWRQPSVEPKAAAGQRRALTRTFLLLAIGALCLAALVAIAILLFGSFGESAGEVLLTVIAIAGYSLLALAVTTALGREPGWLGPLGLAVAAIGFLLVLATIWFDSPSSLVVRLMGTFLVLGVALAHTALLLLVTRRIDEGPVRAVRRATFTASATLTAMSIFPLLSTWEPSGIYLRVLGAFAVLAVLGTLLTPIVQKLASVPLAAPDRTAHAAETEAAGVARLELTYRGRSFVVEPGARQPSTDGGALSAWETTGGDRTPLPGIASRTTEARDPHVAMAVAVERITRLVDDGLAAGSFTDAEDPA